MTKYKIVNYFDVWGNEDDGWEVNDLCYSGEIELSEDFKNDEILEELKDVGFLRDDVTMDMLEIDWSDEYFIEIFQADNYRPICRIEKE